MTDKRKPGRPVGTIKEATKPVILRLSDRHAATYKELGGQRWIRRLLDEATSALTPDSP